MSFGYAALGITASSVPLVTATVHSSAMGRAPVLVSLVSTSSGVALHCHQSLEIPQSFSLVDVWQDQSVFDPTDHGSGSGSAAIALFLWDYGCFTALSFVTPDDFQDAPTSTVVACSGMAQVLGFHYKSQLGTHMGE